MKSILTLVGILLCTTFCYGQKVKITQSQRVHIKVYIDKKEQFDTLAVKYREDSWGNISGFELFDADKGPLKYSYYFDIKGGSRIAYFSLSKPPVTSKKLDYISFIPNTIAEAGDDINIYIIKDSTSFEGYRLNFTGNGAAKYQCQYELTQTPKKISKIYYQQLKYNIKNGTTIRDSLFYHNFSVGFENQVKISTEIYKANLVILEKYKAQLSDFMFNLIKAQIYGNLELSNINNFNYPYLFFDDRKSLPDNISVVKKSLSEIFNKRYKPDFKEIPEKYLLLSDNYLNFLIEEIADTTLKKGNHYKFLKNNFKGLLRDRLVTAYFSKYFFRKVGADRDLADALSYIKTDYCRTILSTFNNAFRPGEPALNFQLPDSSGKTIKLSDFKGKVVLMDFWFTGCSGCRNLTEDLRPVAKLFEKSDKVAFISVCIDDDIKKWKNSIRSGLYTHDNGINLSTRAENGKKIIEHYKIYGYPTLILIDKNGKIISGNPPRPNRRGSERELIDLIRKSITE